MVAFAKEDIFLVTGASSGIGAGIAARLNALGASVVACGRQMENLEKLKSQVAAPERLWPEIKDQSSDMDALPTWLKALKEKYGKFKGLINCAGMIDVKPLQLLDETAIKTMFDVNYFSALFLAKGFADRRINTGRGASITFIASIAALVGDRGQIAYGGSKAALIASAKSISRELASQGLRVNSISPGDIATPMNEKAQKDYGFKLSERYVMGIGTVSDVASLACFLASDEARWITGQNYVLDGGYL